MNGPRWISIVALAIVLGLGPASRVSAQDLEPSSSEAPGAAVTDEPAVPPRGPIPAGAAIEIPVHGAITPLLSNFVERKLSEGLARGAKLVIFDIDSPGGFLDLSLALSDRIRDLNDVRTVAYIEQEAISGAAIVALSCDAIYMRPRAVIGDAGPIFMGEDRLFHHAPEKIRSLLVQRMRDLAEAHGRPAALAEAMVDMDLAVFSFTHEPTGRTWYFSEAEHLSRADRDEWERGQRIFESREKTFLTVNGLRAKELQLIDGVVQNAEDVYRLEQLAEPPFQLNRSWVDTTVWVLNWKTVSIAMLFLALASLLLEFSAPGMGVGGLVSLLCFSLFFWSRMLGGTATLLEVILFCCGVMFLAAEIFVLPGFGIAGISGILLIVASLLMASQSVLVPQGARELRELSNALLVVGTAGVGLLIFAGALIAYTGKVPILSSLTLEPPADFSESAADALTRTKDGKRALVGELAPHLGIGDQGETITSLRPSGKARFGDEILDVISEGDFLDASQPIRIIQRQGNRIVVRAV